MQIELYIIMTAYQEHLSKDDQDGPLVTSNEKGGHQGTVQQYV